MLHAGIDNSRHYFKTRNSTSTNKVYKANDILSPKSQLSVLDLNNFGSGKTVKIW